MLRTITLSELLRETWAFAVSEGLIGYSVQQYIRDMYLYSAVNFAIRYY